MISSPFAKPYIVPPTEHPRLMLKRADLSRVRRNLEAPECRLSAELWRSLLQKPVLCKGATPDYGTYNLSEYIAVEAMALQALLTKEKEDARKAIDALLFLLKKSLI